MSQHPGISEELVQVCFETGTCRGDGVEGRNAVAIARIMDMSNVRGDKASKVVLFESSRGEDSHCC